MLSCSSPGGNHSGIDQRVDSLLALMTLDEKIGQLCQVSGTSTQVEEMIQQGKIGSVINEVNPHVINAIQKIAREKSRLGIPLIIGRDVIHGFKTIFPIPLGQAATWNPEIVMKGAQVSAKEARSIGIHWTFSPMLDVSRDARWGRIAEGFGEDTYLTQILGTAMIEGYQGNNLASNCSIAACAKHFAAYGAAEGGRDYNTADMSLQTLYNVYLLPFKAAVDAGVATFMVSFNEINGIPSSGNELLVRDLLKNIWQFNGFVVSDWASIWEMINHGFASDNKQAAELAMKAGVDMEMVTATYAENIARLIQEGVINEELLNDAVTRILRVKFQLGLFTNPYVDEVVHFDTLAPEHLKVAYESAVQSLVLLQNQNNVLPLDQKVQRIAVVGPMADDSYEQLGTWIFDGEERHSVTPLQALVDYLGKEKILYEKALTSTRDKDRSRFGNAFREACYSDATLVFVGEESILSGEAHSRADITLPGAQEDLIKELYKSGKPVIVVVMAGRPLALSSIESYCNAILYAWHPGTMGGPAIADVIFGKRYPSGRLPVTFPAMSGEEPLYYNHKATGRPPRADQYTPIEHIAVRAPQTSLGNTSHYLDAGYEPEFPFGFGLSYTTFQYSDLLLSRDTIGRHDSLIVTVHLKNTGPREGKETVQLYIRDVVGTTTRPVKELKAFRQEVVLPGEEKIIQFQLSANDLGFFNSSLEWAIEPGEFIVFVGSNSRDLLDAKFRLVD
jgi:beta-glucosidase